MMNFHTFYLTAIENSDIDAVIAAYRSKNNLIEIARSAPSISYSRDKFGMPIPVICVTSTFRGFAGAFIDGVADDLMSIKFSTFFTTFESEDINDLAYNYATKHNLTETDRSAPSICKSGEDYIVGITSKFEKI